MRLRLAALALAAAMPAAAEEAVKVYAAGSLSAALRAAGGLYSSTHPAAVVNFEFGPSGILKDRLAAGEKADLFASANMDHPEALARAGKAGQVRLFARNKLCALTHPETHATTANLLDRMLDPKVKLGTSTPKADPAGDYALLVFERADKVKPGANAALTAKALQLTGGPNALPVPKDRNAYGVMVAERRADIFITYCTGAVLARKEEPALEIVALPESLAVGADYGMTLLANASPAAIRFSTFLLSPAGQGVLARYGFSPVSPK
jgi:ABC-type molybdate transport system substrate-binding protein